MKFGTARTQLVNYAMLFVLAVVLAAGASPRFPQADQSKNASELVLKLDPKLSKVHWTLGTTLHTVHGTFAFNQGTLRLNPETGKASGAIFVDAASGESGNDSRDKKMHKDVLESAKFTDVIFKPDRVEGKVTMPGTASVQVHGVITIHGTKHEITVPIQAELTADRWKGTGKFAIPFLSWGLKNPSNFLLRVDPDVNIELEMSGSLEKVAAQ